MKNLLHIILFVSVLVFSSNSIAQNNVSFDYSISQTGEGEYEILMSIPEPLNVQFIEIGFLDSPDSEFSDEVFVASLNKKSDNNYYFFLNNQEVKINPEEFVFQISRQEPERIGADLDNSVLIKLMDKDLQVLNTYQQVITN